MKKIVIYIMLFVFVCFLLPAALTKTGKRQIETNSKAENETIVEEQTQEEVQYDYQKYDKIKLLHTETGEVEEVQIDDYLVNVVSAEMPATFEVEALKAQAVVARTYTIYKANSKKHENADVCDDPNCCQAWISKDDRLAKWEEDKRESNWTKIQDSVNQTKGIIITYGNQPINAFFHSNSGGTTEIATNVWGGGDYPYLQVVETAGEEGYTQYASEVQLSREDLINKLKESYSDISINFDDPEDMKILELTESGRVKTVKFGNHNISGTEARTLLSLKSTNFEIKQEDNLITFSVKGYGHGVGMSQTGADAMAKNGSTYEDIIKHFYVGVELKDVNSI